MSIIKKLYSRNKRIYLSGCRSTWTSMFHPAALPKLSLRTNSTSQHACSARRWRMNREHGRFANTSRRYVGWRIFVKRKAICVRLRATKFASKPERNTNSTLAGVLMAVVTQLSKVPLKHPRGGCPASRSLCGCSDQEQQR